MLLSWMTLTVGSTTRARREEAQFNRRLAQIWIKMLPDQGRLGGGEKQQEAKGTRSDIREATGFLGNRKEELNPEGIRGAVEGPHPSPMAPSFWFLRRQSYWGRGVEVCAADSAAA